MSSPLQAKSGFAICKRACQLCNRLTTPAISRGWRKTRYRQECRRAANASLERGVIQRNRRTLSISLVAPTNAAARITAGWPAATASARRACIVRILTGPGVRVPPRGSPSRPGLAVALAPSLPFPRTRPPSIGYAHPPSPRRKTSQAWSWPTTMSWPSG